MSEGGEDDLRMRSATSCLKAFLGARTGLSITSGITHVLHNNEAAINPQTNNSIAMNITTVWVCVRVRACVCACVVVVVVDLVVVVEFVCATCHLDATVGSSWEASTRALRRRCTCFSSVKQTKGRAIEHRACLCVHLVFTPKERWTKR